MLKENDISVIVKVIQDIILKTVEYCSILGYSYEDTLEHISTKAYSDKVLEVIEDILGHDGFTSEMLVNTMQDYKRAQLIKKVWARYNREV